MDGAQLQATETLREDSLFFTTVSREIPSTRRPRIHQMFLN